MTISDLLRRVFVIRNHLYTQCHIHFIHGYESVLMLIDVINTTYTMGRLDSLLSV